MTVSSGQEAVSGKTPEKKRMRRRVIVLICLLLTVLLLTVSTEAQQPRKVLRIGYLANGPYRPEDSESRRSRMPLAPRLYRGVADDFRF
jgi:hypothetical protein